MKVLRSLVLSLAIAGLMSFASAQSETESYPPTPEQQQAASRAIVQHLERLKSGKHEEVYRTASYKLRQLTSEEQFIELMSDQDSVLGIVSQLKVSYQSWSKRGSVTQVAQEVVLQTNKNATMCGFLVFEERNDEFEFLLQDLFIVDQRLTSLTPNELIETLSRPGCQPVLARLQQLING